MVVLVDRTPLHEAPPRRGDSSAARVQKGMPVNPPPGILGTVEGLGVRGNRNDAEARLIAVCRELTDDDLFTATQGRG